MFLEQTLQLKLCKHVFLFSINTQTVHSVYFAVCVCLCVKAWMSVNAPAHVRSEPPHSPSSSSFNFLCRLLAFFSGPLTRSGSWRTFLSDPRRLEASVLLLGLFSFLLRGSNKHQALTHTRTHIKAYLHVALVIWKTFFTRFFSFLMFFFSLIREEFKIMKWTKIRASSQPWSHFMLPLGDSH